MHAPSPTIAAEQSSDGVSIEHLDDLCLVHISGRSLGVQQTSRLGEKLIEFIAHRKCRKLLISFEEVGCLYDFLVDNPSRLRSRIKARRETRARACAVGSDHWVG